ncbi:MAG TPA: trypsin-like peptidase domain-containing protein [Bacteroidia bacterium]|jgi:serine protease Do|nr:trypsin-like peptidase domain-containing protein [Bacteroidia bacterium]
MPKVKIHVILLLQLLFALTAFSKDHYKLKFLCQGVTRNTSSADSAIIYYSDEEKYNNRSVSAVKFEDGTKSGGNFGSGDSFSPEVRYGWDFERVVEKRLKSHNLHDSSSNTLFGSTVYYIHPIVTRVMVIGVAGKKKFGIFKNEILFEIINNYGDTVLKVRTRAEVFKNLKSKNNKEFCAMRDSAAFLLFETTVDKFLDSDSLKMLINDFESGKVMYTDNIKLDSSKAYLNNDASVAGNAVVVIKTNKGHGSGCIVSANGYILTSYHLVCSGTTSISVFNGEIKATNAKLIRKSERCDLALLKIEAKGLSPLKFDTVAKVGSEVYAIGTPLDIELGQSTSKGIISGKRNVDGNQLFQLDMKINAGNSGGALLNKNAKLIGVINSKMVGRSVESISFAVAIKKAMETLKLTY